MKDTCTLSTFATRAVLYKGCSITFDNRTVVENYHMCSFSHPTQRDLVIVLEMERNFFKAWLLLRLFEEKSSHIVFRGQEIIRCCLYLRFLNLQICVSDDQWSQIRWKPKLFLKKRIVWFLSSSGQLSIV